MRKYSAVMLGISILIVAAVMLYADPTKLADAVSGADPALLLLAFLLSTASLLLRVLKWSILVNVSFLELFPVQMLGVAASNFTPGKVGEPAKALLLKMRTNRPVSKTLPSIFWERVLDITVLLLLSAVAMHAFSGFFILFVAGAVVFAVIAALLLLVLHSRKFGARLFSAAKRLPVLSRISPDFVESFYGARTSRSRVAAAFAVTFAPWVLDGIVLFFVLASLGVDAPLIIMPGIVAMAVILGIASSLPGGLGTTEVVMSAILVSIGIAGSTAVAAVLLSRLLSFWYGALLGSLSFIYLSRRISMKDIF